MSEQGLILRPEQNLSPGRHRRKRWRFAILLTLLIAAVAVASVYWFSRQQDDPRLSELSSRARRGELPAQFEIGKVYQHGLNGVPKDTQKAIAWYTKAAEHGEPRAQNNLGIMYKTGEGVSQDYSTALLWFRKAAEQGNPRAQSNLGLMYAGGEGVTRDYSTAFLWFQKSAEQGDKRGEANLARAFESGLGVPQNYSEAFKWGKKAAEDGDAESQWAVCGMYAIGKGVQSDATLGYAWCLVAQTSGSTRAKGLTVATANFLSRAQIAEAQSLAAQWWSSRKQHALMPEHSKNGGRISANARIPSAVPAVPDRGRTPNVPPARPSGASGCESGHWVESVSGNGSVVTLEDGSVWKIADIDTVDTQLWLATEDVLVCEGRLINTENGDSVDATRLK